MEMIIHIRTMLMTKTRPRKQVTFAGFGTVIHFMFKALSILLYYMGQIMDNLDHWGWTTTMLNDKLGWWGCEICSSRVTSGPGHVFKRTAEVCSLSLSKSWNQPRQSSIVFVETESNEVAIFWIQVKPSFGLLGSENWVLYVNSSNIPKTYFWVSVADPIAPSWEPSVVMHNTGPKISSVDFCTQRETSLVTVDRRDNPVFKC